MTGSNIFIRRSAEWSANPNDVKYDYIDAGGTLWNVDRVDNGVNIVLWNESAWGLIRYRWVLLGKFGREYKPHLEVS
jgi:hypothetical protein